MIHFLRTAWTLYRNTISIFSFLGKKDDALHSKIIKKITHFQVFFTNQEKDITNKRTLFKNDPFFGIKMLCNLYLFGDNTLFYFSGKIILKIRRRKLDGFVVCFYCPIQDSSRRITFLWIFVREKNMDPPNLLFYRKC